MGFVSSIPFAANQTFRFNLEFFPFNVPLRLERSILCFVIAAYKVTQHPIDSNWLLLPEDARCIRKRRAVFVVGIQYIDVVAVVVVYFVGEYIPTIRGATDPNDDGLLLREHSILSYMKTVIIY